MKLRLKNLLSELTKSTYVSPSGLWVGSVSTSLTGTTGTFYRLSNFSDYSSSSPYVHPDFFEKTTNGLKVLKPGAYHYSVSCHMNTTSPVVLSMRMYNYTTSTVVSDAARYIDCDSHGYGHLAIDGCFYTTTKDFELIPQWSRYSGSNAFRPSYVMYTLTYLGTK